MQNVFLSKLGRVTADHLYIPQIDALRLIAILPVLLLHIAAVLSDTFGRLPSTRNPVWIGISHGVNGVYLFFTISGFILGLPFARHLLRGAKPVALSRYFLRRLTRLEPPFILSILLIFFIKVSADHIYARHTSFESLLPHLLATVTYTHLLIYHAHSLVSGLTWSLEIEVQFYCLMPLLASIFKIRPPALRRGLFLLAILANGAAASYWSKSTLVTCTIIGFLPFFLAGLFVADLYVTGDLEWFTRQHRFPWRPGLDALTIVLWPLSFLLPIRLTSLLLPAVLILLFVDALKGWIAPRLLGIRFLAVIGGMSYTMYLYQSFVFSSAVLLMRRFHALPYGDLYLYTVALMIPVLIAFTCVMYLLIERPCMNPDWPRHLRSLLTRKKTAGEIRLESPLPRNELSTD